MIQITYEQLRTAMPAASPINCEKFLPHINKTLAKYDINTRLRIAHFLAQIAWESGSLRYTEEIASGAAYDTGKLAKQLGNTTAKDGDGQRYKGRGLIQLTGTTNYRNYGKAVGVDFLTEGRWKLLATPQYAADSAGWFWKTHGLNERADRDEHTNITKIINGSTATAKKRLPCLRNAKIAMGLIRV